MDRTNKSCREFVSDLASSSPVPGGGGAAALAGALGTALGNMTGSLTVGKKRYAAVENEMISLSKKCDALQTELLNQESADEEGFLPIMEAYSIPKSDPKRAFMLQEAAVGACRAPMRIMELCCEALDCVGVFAEKGSRGAISDAGCAAALLKAALQAASLNVFINTKSLKDRTAAKDINDKCLVILKKYCPVADKIFETIKSSLFTEV